MSTIDHVLLTRFNLPTPGVESTIRAKDGWLRDRMVLFERYCLPSVALQTNRNFRWIIYFDPLSPQWLLDRITELEHDGVCVPIFRESVEKAALRSDLRKVTGAAGSVLITTNLDNDDALAIDFIERLQSDATLPDRGTERSAIYFENGIIKSPSALYRRSDRHNAFCSVRENWTDPMTCWVDWHDLLPRHMAARTLGGDPGWLQVIHGSNVSNRVRGARIRRGTLAALFPRMLDEVEDPTGWRLARERLVVEPLRGARELSRLAAKNAVRAVLGKDGLDRLKSGLAGVRGTRR